MPPPLSTLDFSLETLEEDCCHLKMCEKTSKRIIFKEPEGEDERRVKRVVGILFSEYVGMYIIRSFK